MCRWSPGGPAKHGHAGAFLICCGLHADAISRSQLQGDRQGELRPISLADCADVNLRHRWPGAKQLSSRYRASPRAPAGASLLGHPKEALCLPAGLQPCVGANTACCQYRRPGGRM